mmetsp:Transcript_25337/g.71058  ORF Transcript_25337/g.71058 Transcript_25337/m.71058 type:complete len:213 (-) Transcript_25337:1359-1997(-)
MRRAMMRLVRRREISGRMSTATVGRTGTRPTAWLRPSSGPEPSSAPRVKKRVSLVMLATICRSSSVTVGKTGTRDREAPGSSMGTRRPSRPRLAARSMSCSRERASIDLTTSSSRNSRNVAPSSLNTKVKASRACASPPATSAPVAEPGAGPGPGTRLPPARKLGTACRPPGARSSGSSLKFPVAVRELRLNVSNASKTSMSLSASNTEFLP